MRVKYTILGLLLILLISAVLLVSAYTDTALKGKNISPKELEEIYPCLNKTCGQNEVCKEGECVCDENFKSCQGKSGCIPKNGCCSDSNCGFGETCIDDKCRFSCKNVGVFSNKVCDSAAEDLVCLSGYAWCEEQFQCIPNDHCCKKFECSSGKKCVLTAWSAEVCLETTVKNCKFIDENEEKILEIGEKQVVVKMLDFFYEQRAKMSIDGKEVDLNRRGRHFIDSDTSIFLAQIKEHGGSCKASS